MKLPTKKQCSVLFKKYEMLPIVLKHSKLVEKIAVYLAKRLKESGENVDIDVVDRAALLHDIAKSRVVKASNGMINGEKDMHHIEGEEILKKEGYPELGRIVRLHSLKEMENLRDWEEKIIKYADLRVKHDDIVSVRERLDDLNKRYNIPEHLRIDEKKVFALEKEIYSKLDESPDVLKYKVKHGR